MKHLTNFLREDRGQDMVEYGLLAAFISVVAIGALSLIKTEVVAVFNRIYLALSSS